ncbi:MAG: HEPN domain-containing protein [Scytonema hyalinum WJT4-NPBG1]|jgi:HEPN domain-containing protein|nr:HEPN domain-containing protein [Scytonema hyalinum WJT4-NPBG1]
MGIKIIPLEEAYPDGGFNQNKGKSSNFYSAGLEYLMVSNLLLEKRLGIYNVLLPTIHQAIELFMKALIARIDSNVDCKKYRHDTIEILKDYQNEIPIFASILANPERKELIKQLKIGYLQLKYSEVFLYSHYDDIKLCFTIAEELVDVYQKLIGISKSSHDLPNNISNLPND